MTRAILIIMILAALGFTGCGSGSQPAGESTQTTAEATAQNADSRAKDHRTEENPVFDELKEKLTATEDSAEKLTLASRFLENHPDNPRVSRVLEAALYYLAKERGEGDESIRLAEESISRASDPDRIREMQLIMAGLHGSQGRTEDLDRLAADLEAGRSLTYKEHQALAEAALECEAWDLAARHAGTGLELADAVTVRADNPERELSDEEVEEAVDRRLSQTLAGRGWALANLGRNDEALADFTRAEPHVSRNFAGVPESSLFIHWGRTLLRLDDYKGAMEKLAVDAVMGGSLEAETAYREAYTELTGSDTGFEDHLWTTRQELATVVDDFTLSDYDGNPLSLKSFEGKVVLLAFWFPT